MNQPAPETQQRGSLILKAIALRGKLAIARTQNQVTK